MIVKNNLRFYQLNFLWLVLFTSFKDISVGSVVSIVRYVKANSIDKYRLV